MMGFDTKILIFTITFSCISASVGFSPYASHSKVSAVFPRNSPSAFQTLKNMSVMSEVRNGMLLMCCLF